jgi:Zn-dependent protease
LNIDIDQIRRAIFYLPAIVLCVSMHEYGHAWVANRLGDPTPRMQGRLKLSPLRHISWVGTLLIPVIELVPVAFGLLAVPWMAWGRPVQTNPPGDNRLPVRTWRVVVSIAGPAMNLLMALLLSIVVVVGAHVSALARSWPWFQLVELNLNLMWFNLLPIPGLDGFSVLSQLLPRSWHGIADFLERHRVGSIILLVLLAGIVFYPADVLVRLWMRGLSLAINL